MKKVIVVEDKSQAKKDGNLYVWRNWDQEGALNYTGATTLKRYHEINEESYHKEHKGIFYAFSDQQFMEGLDKIGIPRDDFKGKVFHVAGGCYGTKQGIHDLLEYISQKENRIKEECDPQEVYIDEYNNHECMIDWDGDDNAIKIIIDTWGIEVAKKIRRWNICNSVDDLAKSEK